MTIKIIRLNVQFNDHSPGLVLHRPDFRYDLSSEIVTSAIVKGHTKMSPTEKMSPT